MRDNTGKLLALESLRGLAALSVAIYHFDIGSHLNIAFTKNAWLMVDFFFVLSGFVIALNYQAKVKDFGSLRSFQIKRFLRLYPLHLIMLFAFLAVEIAKYIVETKFGLTANNPAFVVNNSYAFLSNLLLIHNWTIPHLTFNSQSWSISAEFYTYAIFGTVLLVPRMINNQVLLISLILISVTGYILFKNGFGTDCLTGPSRCIYSFFLGVISYNIYHRIQGININSSYFSLAGIIISIALIIQFGHDHKGKMVAVIPVVFALSILLIVWTPANTAIQRILTNTYLVYLGSISYGLYMIHGLVWWIYFQIFRFAFSIPQREINGSPIPYFTNPFLADVAVVSGLILVVLLSHFSYRLIEERFNKLRHSIQ